MTDTSLAALYPSMLVAQPPPQQEPSPPAQTPDEQTLAIVVPGSIAEMRKAPARVLYNASLEYAPAFALRGELANICADLSLSRDEASSIAALVRLGPRSEDQQDIDFDEAARYVTEESVADVRKLVARDPRVAALIEHFGLGNDVRVLRILVGAAAREKSRGRL